MTGLGNNQLAKDYRRAAYLATYYRWSAARFTTETPMGNDPATGRPWGQDRVAMRAHREAQKAMARTWHDQARALRRQIEAQGNLPVLGCDGWGRDQDGRYRLDPNSRTYIHAA